MRREKEILERLAKLLYSMRWRRKPLISDQAYEILLAEIRTIQAGL